MSGAWQGKFPVAMVRDFVFRLNDRLKMRDRDAATSAEFILSVDDARIFYAAFKWMEFMEIRGASLEQTKVPFRDCLDFIKAKAEALKKGGEEDRTLTLNAYGIKAMMSIERHIDHLAISEEDKGGKKGGKRR